MPGSGDLLGEGGRRLVGLPPLLLVVGVRSRRVGENERKRAGDQEQENSRAGEQESLTSPHGPVCSLL